jgi:hypothetical protein
MQQAALAQPALGPPGLQIVALFLGCSAASLLLNHCRETQEGQGLTEKGGIRRGRTSCQLPTKTPATVHTVPLPPQAPPELAAAAAAASAAPALAFVELRRVCLVLTAWLLLAWRPVGWV